MAELDTDPFAVGETALAAGDWEAARKAFETALGQDDEPAARDGLARALWRIEGPRLAVAERTRAYSGYRRRGDDRAAAHVALWIAHEYEVGFGNAAAAGGWLTRAAGLLEQLPEGPDHARLELVRGERAGDRGFVMIEHRIEVTLEQQPERAFDFFVDFRNEPAWNPDCLTVEKTSDGPIGVGTRFIGKMKRVGSSESEIVAPDRPGHSSVVDRSRGAEGTFDFRFTPHDGGTRVEVTMRMQPRGPMRLLEPLIARIARRMLVDLPEKMRRGIDVTTKQAEMPSAPMTTPAAAGPTTLPALKKLVLSATAFGSSSRPTSQSFLFVQEQRQRPDCRLELLELVRLEPPQARGKPRRAPRPDRPENPPALRCDRQPDPPAVGADRAFDET